MKVTEKKRLGKVWVMQCKCGNILCHASEREFLPAFEICSRCSKQVTKSEL